MTGSPATRTLGSGLLAAVLAAAGAVSAAAQNEDFPNTRERGRAAVEYKDDRMHVVAAYYYSQRNHDQRWLLVQAAVSTTARIAIHRHDILMITPDGREIPLARQEDFLRDYPAVERVLRNASTQRHGVAAYFAVGEYLRMRFFAGPPGSGIVHNSFAVNKDWVVTGDLFFASPRGLWDEGTHELLIQAGEDFASLPIELE